MISQLHRDASLAEVKKHLSRPEESEQGNYAYPLIFWTHPEILWILTGNLHLSFENTWRHAAVWKQNCNLNSSVLQEIPSQAILFSLHYLLSYLLELLLFFPLFSSQESSIQLSFPSFYCQCSFKNVATDKNLSSLPSFLIAFWAWLGVS